MIHYVPTWSIQFQSFQKAIQLDSTQGSYLYNYGRAKYYLTIINILVNNGSWVAPSAPTTHTTTSDGDDDEKTHSLKQLKDIKLTGKNHITCKQAQQT